MDIIDTIFEAIENKVRQDLNDGGIMDLTLSVRDMCKYEWHEIRNRIDERFEK